MKNCVLCHKFRQVLVDLTFLDLGKKDSHSQGGLTCALLLVVSQGHRVILIPQGRLVLIPGSERADVQVGRDTLTQGLDS